MEHEHTTHTHAEHAPRSRQITTPQAIIVAGVLIGLGIFFGDAVRGTSDLGSPAKNSDKIVLGGQDPVLSPITSSDHVTGNTRDANVVLVEFSDLECPFCKVFHPTAKQLAADNPNVMLVYRHFPLPIHPLAQKESEAAECAASLGGKDMFWLYIDRIFEITPSNNKLNPALLTSTAKELGLDENKFNECLSGGTFEKFVKDQIDDGVAAGVNGTPNTIVLIKKGNNYEPFASINGAQPLKAAQSIVDSATKEATGK